MSTYTDLKNRVKETITVGFRPEDRITTQKVRFYNEENEYWGSFSGSLNGKINIYDGKLSSVDIYGATLIDPVLKTSEGEIIELGSLGDQVQEISTYAYRTLSGAISSYADDISACQNSINVISSAISAIPTDTSEQLSALTLSVMELSGDFGLYSENETAARENGDAETLSSAKAYSDAVRHYELNQIDPRP